MPQGAAVVEQLQVEPSLGQETKELLLLAVLVLLVLLQLLLVQEILIREAAGVEAMPRH
jgi:hypothetical protein